MTAGIPRAISRARWDALGLNPEVHARWIAGAFEGTRYVARKNGGVMRVTIPEHVFLRCGTVEEVEDASRHLYLDL